MTEEKERKTVFEFFPTGDEFEDWSLQDDMEYALSAAMEELQPDNTIWYAEVSNFGWRGLDGVTGPLDVGTDRSALRLLQLILPNTPCCFRIFMDDEALYIQNFHHDSPMGREWYTVHPQTKLVEGLIQSIQKKFPRRDEDEVENWVREMVAREDINPLYEEKAVEMYGDAVKSGEVW